MLAALLLALPLQAAPSAFQVQADGITAGVRKHVPGARLMRAEAALDATGAGGCGTDAHGNPWELTFVDPKGGTWKLARCLDGTKPAPASARRADPVRAPYLGVEELLAGLAKRGVVPPRNGGVSAKLEGGTWTLSFGLGTFTLDAASGEPRRRKAAVLGRAPGGLKPRGETARAEWDKVREVQRARFPGAHLLGVIGISDQDGALLCFEPRDGWSYYFAAGDEIKEFFACAGRVVMRRAGLAFQPSPQMHLAISGRWVDSHLARAAMGPDRAKSRGTMRLLHHRLSPFEGRDLLWEIHDGTGWHFVDARTGEYLGK